MIRINPKIKKLESKYEAKGQRLRGMLLLRAQEAFSLLQDAQRQDFFLLGINAVCIKPDRISAYKKYSTDVAYHTGSNKEFFVSSRKLIQKAAKRKTPIWFEVVILDKSSWLSDKKLLDFDTPETEAELTTKPEMAF